MSAEIDMQAFLEKEKDTLPPFLVPKELIIPEDLVANPGEIVCGIPVSEAHKRDRRKIVGEVYAKRKYITTEDLHDGEYYDEYEDASIPLVAIRDGEVIGSLRLIRNLPDENIIAPISTKEMGKKIYEDKKEQIKNIPIEWSQFVTKKNPHDNDYISPVPGLIRAAFVYSWSQNMTEAAALLDSKVRDYLTDETGGYHFNLPKVGEDKWHMGSLTTPVILDFGEMIRSASRNGDEHHLGEFLQHGQAEGYDAFRKI